MKSACALLLVCCVGMASCSNMNSTQQRALSGTAIANAKGLHSVFGPSSATLNGGRVSVHAAPYSVTVFEVQ